MTEQKSKKPVKTLTLADLEKITGGMMKGGDEGKTSKPGGVD